MKVQNNLSFIRKQRGLTVSQTAALIGVTRQTVYAIEAGSYIPNTLVALKLSAAFCVAVEDLFFLNSLEDELSNCDTAHVLPGAAMAEVGQPVHLVKVGKRLIATDLATSRDFRHPPDGVVVGMEPAKKATVKVQTFPQTDRTRKRLLVSGDDPAFQVLGHHLQLSGIDLITIDKLNSNPFDLLRHGLTHIAYHCVSSERDQMEGAKLSRTDLRNMSIIGFYSAQEGIAVAAGNPKHIATIDDFIRSDVMIINREPGTRCRMLLDEALNSVKKRDRINGYNHVIQGHMPAAWHVHMRKADGCITTRQAAKAFGLDFIPLSQRHCSLVMQKTTVNLPEIIEMIDILHRASFRRELELCNGCEAVSAGQILSAMPTL